MKLPGEFLDKMRMLLGNEEYQLFLESYNKPRYYGLRVNTLKVSVDKFLNISPFKLRPVPWTKEGFYYPEEENPGKHPYYHAGLYYIQEPSAMFPGTILQASPGERILDLCAAPGGKTVQIAAAMRGEGIIVSNDISSQRIKALVKNIELCGVKNAVVTNESPEVLAVKFKGFFDKILVDAPCSGEGMFRKDESAARSWEKYKSSKCAAIQREILESADIMLREGGYLIYSTCTFSPEENEIIIAEFIDKHSEYETVKIPNKNGVEPGRTDWCGGRKEIANAARLWPHKLEGEGHFTALLKKKGKDETSCLINNCIKKTNKRNGENNSQYNNKLQGILEIYRQFEEENLNIRLEGNFELRGNYLYVTPGNLPDMSGIKVIKPGLLVGSFRENRFEPSHSFVISLKKEDVKRTIDFKADSREIASYLKGETIMEIGMKGLTAVCVDGFTIGWAKQTGEYLKNLYPSGWRKMV
ncbi:MAG TPA: NOL1/NOP2/sun family putative RNA methylase [Clostridiaceae bacterium]|nr:NOL1/NOP2/sun family putative RNA methylase [Clostridiaceae bacterium]